MSTTLIGHGQLGSQDSLRDFVSLVDETSHQKDLTIELRPVLVIEDWAVESGNMYVASFEQFFDGRRLDVVNVKSLLDTGLTRVESTAQCEATPGSFYYDPDIEYPDINGLMVTQWDLAGINWDGAGLLWDQFPRIFIHLFDGSNPNNTIVVGQCGFYFATRAMVQPALGSRKETNGDFENWDDGVLDGWEGIANGIDFWDDTVTDWDDVGAVWDPVLSLITQETEDVRSGLSAVRFTPSGSNFALNQQQIDTFIEGKQYRISGFYKVNSGTAGVQIQDSAATRFVGPDGRTIATSTHSFLFTDTGEEWRRFFIDFRAFTTSFLIKFGGIGTGSGADVLFDNLRIQRIYRQNYYEPRVASDNIPRNQSGSNDIFFGGKRIGSGSVSLINSDGYMERLVADFEWMNCDVIVMSGGAFLDGQEISVEDYRQTFSGLIQDIDINDEEATFQLQDLRAFFHRTLPNRVYDDVEFPNMDTKNFLGKVRPLFFGAKENIRAARIDLTAFDYGVYEICDAENSPNGMKSVDLVYAYVDETSATLQRPDQRNQLTFGTDFNMDLATGYLTVLRDIGPYEITDENNFIDFDEGGSELTAELTIGIYAAADLASEIQTQMRAVGSSDLTCSYSEVDHKISIGKGAGTLNLLIKSGSNKDIAPWKLIGYKPSADKSGSLSYEAENAMFEDVDRDHIIRINAQGFKDDAVGTFTGIPLGLIEIGSDILRVILVKYMGKSPSVIDEASFLFARQRAPESLAIYLNESTSTKDIFSRLEFSNIANIIVSGDGKVSYKVYVGDIPSNIKTIEDRDIQSFNSGRSVADVYAVIRVRHDKDPTLGNFKTRQAEDESVSIRLGRPEPREFETYIKKSDNAISAANRLLELARTANRRIETTTLGGQFVDLNVGDKVRLNRKRALAPGGRIQNQVFRIISVSKQEVEGLVDMKLVDDRVTVANDACISVCQQFCEGGNCQVGCEQICQEFCQINLQGPCASSCQQDCELGCQESCQTTTCEETCETTCQDSCELVCQACEGGGCQQQCESSCQSGCEVGGCQTVCQTAGCQSACQQGECQAACQSECQSDCQQGVTCQTNCQTGVNCQETCEQNCQSGCQGTCQSGCQTGACQTISEGI